VSVKPEYGPIGILRGATSRSGRGPAASEATQRGDCVPNNNNNNNNVSVVTSELESISPSKEEQGAALRAFLERKDVLYGESLIDRRSDHRQRPALFQTVSNDDVFLCNKPPGGSGYLMGCLALRIRYRTWTQRWSLFPFPFVQFLVFMFWTPAGFPSNVILRAISHLIGPETIKCNAPPVGLETHTVPYRLLSLQSHVRVLFYCRH